MMKLHTVSEKDSGNIIASGLSEKEADRVLYNLEKTDKLAGNYTNNFYKINKLYHVIKIFLN
jgi:hypothetical protein